MKVFDLASSVPWLIQAETLHTILEIAARENPTPEAVAAQLGRPLDNTHTVTYRDGVAIIPVDGPIFRHANLFTEVSGATSTEILALDLHAALTDTTVQAILLAIDSPGGEANGISEFANMVYDARTQKPLMAYISGYGASAAYWIASAASEVVADHLAHVGSIGAVTAVRDPTKTGTRDIRFISSQSPHKQADPTTEKGRSQYQGLVDALANVFMESVARNRGVSMETVASDFGAGALFLGQDAVDAGLVDRLGSLEGCIAELAARHGQPFEMRAAADAGQTDEQEAQMARQRQQTPQDADETPVPPVQVDVEAHRGQQQEDGLMAAETTTTAGQEQAVDSKERETAKATATPDVTTDLAARMAAIEAENAALKAANAAVTAQAADAAAQVKAMQKAGQRAQFAAMAKDWFGPVEDHVVMMEKLTEHGLTAELEGYQTRARAHAEQLKASALFETKGRTGSEASDGTAEAKVQGMAKALRETNPKLTPEQAYTKVLADNPKLYEQILVGH